MANALERLTFAFVAIQTNNYKQWSQALRSYIGESTPPKRNFCIESVYNKAVLTVDYSASSVKRSDMITKSWVKSTIKLRVPIRPVSAAKLNQQYERSKRGQSTSCQRVRVVLRCFTKSIHQMEKQVRDFFDSFQGPCKREHPLGIHKLDAVPAQPELTFWGVKLGDYYTGRNPFTFSPSQVGVEGFRRADSSVSSTGTKWAHKQTSRSDIVSQERSWPLQGIICTSSCKLSRREGL